MKHARKLASLLLALVMVFALAVTVAAEGTTEPAKGSITVDNPIKGQTYTAYKIFDVVYDTADHYSYTIEGGDGGSPWYGTVDTYATEANGLKLSKVGDTTTYVVTFNKDKFSAPSFAAALKKALTDGTVTDAGTPLATEGTSVSVKNLLLGYYFVKSSANDALCNLTTTNPAVTIHDKNDMPFSKTDDKVSAEVGETVNYTIKGKVPDYTGFKTYTYLITDTMSVGLTFKKDVKVTVGGTDVTNDCTPTYDVESNANKFTVSIPVKSYPIGAEILVTYSALVNENAVAKISKNSATLTYSNNPSDSTKTDTTTTVEETVYSSKIVIDKFETGKQETVKLPGAKFVLYKKAPTETDQNAIQYYKKWADTDTTKAVTWVDSITDATEVTTNDNGEAFFEGLADGTYYLVETKAPAGYNQLTAPVAVPVNDGTTETALTVTANVANQAGTLLPSTGGMGTTLFYVIGGGLMVAAIVLLVTKKRMEHKN